MPDGVATRQVTNQRREFGVAVLGGPTTVVDIAGLRLVCDPTFDPPTDYGYLQKLAGPAISPEALGNVDAVLLSHDLHPDNFDRAGERFARSCPVILTTPTAAARLGEPAKPLAAGASWTSRQGEITVTAVPAVHGPADGTRDPDGFINSEVAGFILTAADAPRTYISGDNTSLAVVAMVARQFGPIECAILHAGHASVATKFDGRPLSLTAERAAAAAEVLGADDVVVAHQHGWSHFREGPSATLAAFNTAGIAARLRCAELGCWAV